jgi:hypothetical protein
MEVRWWSNNLLFLLFSPLLLLVREWPVIDRFVNGPSSFIYLSYE